MVPVLLIGIPLIAGLIGFSLKDAAAKGWALFISLLTLVVSLIGVSIPGDSKMLSFSTDRTTGRFSRNRCTFILFLLGTGADTGLFPRISMGWGKTDRSNI